MLTWGSDYFNPAKLKLLTPADNMGPTICGQVTLDNGLNLTGAARTIEVLAASGPDAIAKSWGKINGAITDSAGSLIKTGGGILILAGTNTYGGGTTVQAGMLQLGNTTALGATSGPLTVNGGLLNLGDQTVSIGNLSGTGGTIANNGDAVRTLTIGSGNGSGGIYQGVIANKTNTGTGTVALTKTGNGTITLANSNTYTGTTIINGGGTLVLTGTTQATAAITFTASSSLGLVIGSPVTAAGAAVTFANGRVSVTGTPNAPSHVLLTAQSFTGTPVLTTAIPGYELKVVGTQLQLDQIVEDPLPLGPAAHSSTQTPTTTASPTAWPGSSEPPVPTSMPSDSCRPSTTPATRISSSSPTAAATSRPPTLRSGRRMGATPPAGPMRWPERTSSSLPTKMPPGPASTWWK